MSPTWPRRAAKGRVTLALAGFLVAILALAGCGAPAGDGTVDPAPSVAAAAIPTRFAVVDALAATTPPAASPTVTPTPTASPTAPSPTPSPAPPTAAPTTNSPAAPRVPVTAGRIRPGVVYSGRATEHDAGSGDGNCLLGDSDSAMQVVAMNEVDYDNARSCGAYLQVTGPGGTTVVKVVDRCPECPVGALDLSQQAFDRIAGGAQGGLDKVTWRLVSPGDIGPLQFQVKKESSQWWVSLQVRNHRNPVVSLEIQRGGQWVAVARQMYNYFESEGFGPGPFTVRVTDLYGQQIVSTVNLTPGAVQTTSTQFAQH
ncbi:expansin EXLX1 family cellulose-binding protein [Pseudofrankia inefficax]|uniref:Rare lipoprotein A n=1 Tax=Pseudofrankia inefficax (strain DSM 45817 / CECT 9037 / DDB 130130 / EuI1c) TaxID=298654 RepID=E3J6R0_PSEI1|nr:expansin EXLX1 family cellulose-binding protein [Pseudofrankia inefficax]ADP81984.1 Rare lipoprotein A [Pseudofrankia inefficax]